MSINSKAIPNKDKLTDKDKVKIYEDIFEHCAKILCTAPVMRKGKAIGRINTRVQFRESPEWLQEYERVFESAPVNLYDTRSDIWRAMFRLSLFLTTLLFESCADSHELPDKVEEFENSKTIQIMLQAIQRHDMTTNISSLYQEIRRIWIEKKPRDLTSKLIEIEHQEARHINTIKPSPISDDNINKIKLPNKIGAKIKSPE